MRPFEILPTVIHVADKGGTGKSLITALLIEPRAIKTSAARHGNDCITSGRGQTGAPSGPRRRGTKKRRD